MSIKPNHSCQHESGQSNTAINRGIVENWVKSYSHLPLNELEIMAQGMSELDHVLPRSTLRITLAKAIARQGAKNLDAFIDIDECTAHMVSLNVKGDSFILSIKTLLELVRNHGESKGHSNEV